MSCRGLPRMDDRLCIGPTLILWGSVDVLVVCSVLLWMGGYHRCMCCGD